jgi:hypothetical protein
MSELRTLLERSGERVTPRADAFERLRRLRRRKQLARRIEAGVLGLLVAAGGAVGAVAAFHHQGAHPVIVGSGSNPAFHALWPEQVLADAQQAQDLVDGGQNPWRLDAAQVVAAFATEVLGWQDPVPDSGGCFDSDCPFDLDAQAYNVHRGCLTCPAVVVEVQRLIRPGDTGIWSVTRVAGGTPGFSLPFGPGTTVESGSTLEVGAVLPDLATLFAGYTYLGESGVLVRVFVPVHVSDGQIELRVGVPTVDGGEGFLAEPVDGIIFLGVVSPETSGLDSSDFDPFARPTEDTTEVQDLAAVPVRFVPAASPLPTSPTPEPSPDPFPRGAFQWCPDTSGSLPLDSGPSLEAADIALRFARAYAAGNRTAAGALADDGALDQASWAVAGNPATMSVSSHRPAPSDALVTHGCGPEVAARSYAVTLEDGTASASLDFTLYLIQRPDGWKVWGSY